MKTKATRSIWFPAILLLAALVTGCGSGSAPTSVAPVPPSAGAPARLVFTTQPGGGTAGTSFTTQPVVAAQDAQGNIVTGYRGLVVLTITAGTGAPESHLFGGLKVGFVNGVVNFTDIFIDRAGEGYTLTATSGALSGISAPFGVSPGAAFQLAFTTQPAGGVAGSPFVTQPEVTVQDRYGNTVAGYEGAVTLAITGGSGPQRSVLSGATTVRVVKNVARFTDVSIQITNPEYTLTAMSGDLVPATSRRFEVLAAAPVKLGFTVQVEGAQAGKPFDGQPKVAVEDTYGNVVLTSRATIAVSITPGTGTAGAKLSGTLSLVAEGGLGGLTEFEDLSIDKAGKGYTLTAVSTGLTSAVSQAFDVAP